MTPDALIKTFRKYKSTSGVTGVAFGQKEVAGCTNGNPNSVTFFVPEKLPTKGARKRLADGRLCLPKFIEKQGTPIVTDVVGTGAAQSLEGSNKSPPQTYRAGGKISNRSLTGTIGCLVRRRGKAGLFAITNQHIALGEGTRIAFPSFQAGFFFRGETAVSVGLIVDEEFLPPFNNPRSYIDVDCALVRIPAADEGRFTPEIPTFGRPKGIFTPNGSSTSAYSVSLLGKQVFSYSWKSGPRSGVISHVYFVSEDPTTGMIEVECFLVKSLDGLPPGIHGDSGKLWMTKVNGENHAIGVHSGVVSSNSLNGRFAMVTEFASLTRFLDILLV